MQASPKMALRLGATVGLSAVYVGRPARCEERRPSVLVVGGGLTGCLVAYQLRHQGHTVCVAERASYAAGRFGAGHKLGPWCDLGAQVLSVVDAASDHPNAGVTGQGIEGDDVRAAWNLAEELRAAGHLREAPFDSLGDTEERMKYEGLWRHYHAASGLSALLEHFLTEAGAKLVTGCRVDALDRLPPALDFKADVIVIATPAHEAFRLLAARLPADVRERLAAVRYDSRYSLGLRLDAQAEQLRDVFGDAAELTPEDYAENDLDLIHLVALQNVKRGAQEEFREQAVLAVHSVDLSSPRARAATQEAVLAVHSVDLSSPSARAATQEEFREQVLRLVARWGAQVVAMKEVDWSRGACQMVRPLDEEHFPAACYVQGNVVLAGDYFTQSSFTGTFGSAAAAARAVSALLEEQARA